MFKTFLFGILAGFLLILLGAYFFVAGGYMPANADAPPPAWERWMAHTSLHATLDREAPGPVVMEVSESNLHAGVELYEENCLVCHGASDGQASNIALGLYQHAPQLGNHGVEDDPEGEIYWKIKHGIRLTGMPAFSKTLTDTQIWQLTLFLKHMDSLSPEAEKAWKRLPSMSSSSSSH